MVLMDISDDEGKTLKYVSGYIMRSLKKKFDKAKQTQVYSCCTSFLP